MAVLFYLGTRLRRGLAVGLVLAVLLGALGWFACMMVRFVEQKEAEVEAAYDSVPVTVTVSNLKGTQTDGLDLSPNYMGHFLPDLYFSAYWTEEDDLTPYLTDVLVKRNLYYWQLSEKDKVSEDGTLPSQDLGMGAPGLVGATSPDAIPALNATDGTAVTYWREDGEAFFRDGGNYCIVSEGLLADLTPGEDGAYRLSLGVQTGTNSGAAAGLELEVAGVYTGTSTAVYCSWEAVSAVMEVLQFYPTADSLSATVRDNRALEALRPLLAKYFAEVDPQGGIRENGQGQRYDYAITVHDDILRQTLNELNRSLRTIHLLRPLITALELAVAFFACFLYIQIRKRELAAARSLGATQQEVLAALLVEAGLWYAVGAVLALVLVRLLWQGTAAPWGIIAGLGISALAGTAVSGALATGHKGMRSIKEAE